MSRDRSKGYKAPHPMDAKLTPRQALVELVSTVLLFAILCIPAFWLLSIDLVIR